MTRTQSKALMGSLAAVAVMALVLTFDAPLSAQREQEWMADKNDVIIPVDGAELYREYCATCHGRDATGNGPVAPALQKAPPNLTRISQRNGGSFPAERVKEYISGESSLISHGSREMPIWGPIFRQADRDYELGQIRLHNVTVYLESLQKSRIESLIGN